MNSYFFANAAPIDIAAIELMGVSVKSGDSPIGYFGTGLKFAIATCLRHGQIVRMQRRENGQTHEYEFVVEQATIRDKDFGRVVMRAKPEGANAWTRIPLGFTTQLGRNWQLWQAFREFESNCRDENGVSGPAEPPGPWGTVFEIIGQEFTSAAKTHGVFLSSKPLYVNEGLIEIHPLGPNPKAIYHRGVLAGELPRPGRFTYNDLSGTLTEDRTLGSVWWTAYWAGKTLAQQASRMDLEAALLAPEGYWEREAFNNWDEGSPVFDEIVKENRLSNQLNGWARQAWLRKGQNAEADWALAPLDARMLETARDALKIVRRLGVPMGLEDFKVVRGIAGQAYGVVSNGKIYISPHTFDLGARFLASTLYEEWLHLHENLPDESRQMQNWLFEKLATMTEEVMRLEQGAETVEKITLRVSPEARKRLDEAEVFDPMALRPTRLTDDDIPF